MRLDDCPCSGKNMNYFLGPWILLVIFQKNGAHGFEIKKMLSQWLKNSRVSFNISGIYRHLNSFEKRGVVISKWKLSDKGPAKKLYFLTAEGKECLQRWIKTLSIQADLIKYFINKVSELNVPLEKGQSKFYG